MSTEADTIAAGCDPTAAKTVDAARPADGPEGATAVPSYPKSIGPYRIVGRLGDGGMGVVFKAEQDEPIRRTVAVKVIRDDHDTGQVVARFEAERQALARMDHPGIAKVLDAGADAMGRPYFVMELVPGTSITRFCDDRRLSIADRLGLFLQVCDAIGHAHTKAILHRDIKDSNVLAYEADGRPYAKVIDFGIAKAIGGDRLSDRLDRTQAGRPIGTYGSMSPEQVDGSPDVDTRTDVYSLGVLLYELLCGAKPFDGLFRVGGSELDVQRMIRDVDPPRPSTRVLATTTVGGATAAAAVADARRASLPELAKRLRSELEWVPLMAVRKERDRRYASVAELAEDVRNYLADRPLRAGPDTRRYKAGKFARRHAGSIAAGLAVVLSLAVGVTVTTVSLVNETRQRHAAERARAEAVAQRDNARAVVSFVTDDLLGQASVTKRSDRAVRDVLVTAMVDPAIAAVAKRFAGRPLIEASVRALLGEVLNDLGRPTEAVAQTGAAYRTRLRLLGPDDPDTIAAANDYGNALLSADRPADAEPVLADALRRSRAAAGDDDPQTIRVATDEAAALDQLDRPADADRLYKDAADRAARVLPPDDPDAVMYEANYAAFLTTHGRSAEAVPRAKRVWEADSRVLGPDQIETLDALDNYAAALSTSGDAAGAVPLSKRAWDGRLASLGPDHPDTVQSLNNYAMTLDAAGRGAEAEPLAFQAWRWYRGKFGDDAPDTAKAFSRYVKVLVDEGKLADALVLYRTALDRDRARFGPDDGRTVPSLRKWCAILCRLRRWADAEPAYRAALDASVADPARGPAHPITRQLADDDANCLTAMGRPDAAAAVRGRFGPATLPARGPT